MAKKFFPIIRCGDIVIEDNYWSSQLLLFNIMARFRKDIKIVVLCHQTNYRHFCYYSQFLRKIIKIIEKLFLYNIDHVIVVSENTQKEIIELGISAKKISIVPNGFDRPRRSRNVSSKGPHVRLLCVANCCVRKGIEYLLHTMSHLRGMGVVLDIVGDLTNDLPYVHRMKSLTKKLKLEKEVIFHGWLNENPLWELYAGADIFVLPSLWEGFGIVFIEAMFFGLPIVATQVGAIPELVENWKNGLLVPPANSKAMSDAIIRLIESPRLREQMGQEGRSRYKSYLNWKQVGEMFETVLLKIETNS